MASSLACWAPPVAVKVRFPRYWPAISNIVDVVSSMPYTDHFDRNNSSDNKWLTSSGDVSGSWLKIELPTSQQIGTFSIQTPDEGSQLSRLPTSFKIQGSDDDSDWTDLVDVSDISWSNNEIKNWNNTSTTAYKYYRILISANGGSDMVAIGNWNLVNITEHERN